MPVIQRRLQDGTLRAVRYGYGAPVQVGRDGLVAGVHKPIAANVGPTVDTFSDIGTGATINLSPGAYSGRRFFGRASIPSGGGTYVIRDSILCGPDPDGLESACINVSSSFTGTLIVEDSLFDPMPWITDKGKTSLSPWVNGINGAGFTVRRCEITNVVDGLSIIGNAGHSPTVIELNWIHKGYFAHDFEGQSDERTHTDAIQFHRGKNITVRGNLIGGDRDMTGYQATWPDGSNTGDDFENAGIMLKQESSNSDADRLENILIEANWFAGGMSGINFSYDPARPNTFASTIIRNNKFADREPGWGVTRRANGSLSTGDGYYFLRSPALQAQISGNVLESTGAPVPITNGN